MPPPGFEPFLRAICESPDDNVPRLVYADWLDENGDAERAEFIRVQCEANRTRANGWPNHRLEGWARELWRRHGPAWRAREMHPLPGINWTAFDYRRGFPYRAEYNPGPPHGPVGGTIRYDTAGPERLFASAPIQTLIVSGWWALNVMVSTVGSISAARHVRDLLLCPTDGYRGGIGAVFTASYLGGVQRITIRSRRFVLLDTDEERAVCEAATRLPDWSLHVEGQIAALQAGRLREVMGRRFTHTG